VWDNDETVCQRDELLLAGSDRRQAWALAGFLDETAVDTLWVADHLLQADPSSQLDEPMLEAYTTLGYLAAKTSGDPSRRSSAR
jgi:alkanesulfonate monooxygenase SsuD/methylene tetrahydromethanopterin reductase-like flavin-dependent oxidoreductase (luciferase family)